jgi:hypothetical protein
MRTTIFRIMGGKFRTWHRRNTDSIREIRRFVAYPALVIAGLIGIGVFAVDEDGYNAFGCQMRQPRVSSAPPALRVRTSSDAAHANSSTPTAPPLQDKRATHTSLDPQAMAHYIDTELRYGNDASKRTVYFIFQIHALPSGLGYPKSAISNSTEEAAKSQLAVYRILENLHERSGVYVVGNEGVLFSADLAYEDVTDPTHLAKESREEVFEILSKQNLSDDRLLAIIFTNRGTDGAHLAAYKYEALFEVGFEELGTNLRAVEVLRAMLSRGSGDREKLRATVDDFARNARERSMDAIRHTLENTDALYGQGKITTRNAAIVIGAAHFIDYYEAIIEPSNQWGPPEFNAVFIFSREWLNETFPAARGGEKHEGMGPEELYEGLKKLVDVLGEE